MKTKFNAGTADLSSFAITRLSAFPTLAALSAFAILTGPAAWSAGAITFTEKAKEAPQVCAHETLDQLPFGMRFVFSPDLLAELDLKSDQYRELASPSNSEALTRPSRSSPRSRSASFTRPRP